MSSDIVATSNGNCMDFGSVRFIGSLDFSEVVKVLYTVQETLGKEIN
jgi:hypothetical protein